MLLLYLKTRDFRIPKKLTMKKTPKSYPNLISIPSNTPLKITIRAMKDAKMNKNIQKAPQILYFAESILFWPKSKQ
jgi:hypothetical protein